MATWISVCFLALLSFSVLVRGHMRLRCPKPRDWNGPDGQHIQFDNTGNKQGPCGPFSTEYFGMGGVYPLRANAWQTIHVEEAFDHPGAPFRLGLLDESGNLKIMLLDHIPHNDASTADFDNETRFQPYRITVFIPDVACARCSLQLVAVMTDDTIGCGVPTCAYYSDDSSCSGWSPTTPDCGAAPPDAVPCKRPATCYTSYHSCADVSINGSIPIDSTTGTQAFSQPSLWPHASAPQSAGYGYENATWSPQHWLTQPRYPVEFTTMAGDDLCAAVPSPYIPSSSPPPANSHAAKTLILIGLSVGALFVLLASVAKCYSKATQKPPVAADDETFDPEDQGASSDVDSDATAVLSKHPHASASTVASSDELTMRSSLLGPAI